jgi:large subunit ribosomal protein L21
VYALGSARTLSFVGKETNYRNEVDAPEAAFARTCRFQRKCLNSGYDRRLRQTREMHGWHATKNPIERTEMYAVIKTGGKQYRVAAGEKLKVEQIVAEIGQHITIDQVLAVGSGADMKVGSPLVAGATVVATVVAQGRHDKVRIFKMRRRKHYQKRQGHRQAFTEIQISAVNA